MNTMATIPVPLRLLTTNPMNSFEPSVDSVPQC